MNTTRPTSPARRAALTRCLATLISTTLTIPSSSSASKLDKLPLKIASTTAPAALEEFVRQTGLQVLFEFDAIRHFTTHEVDGQLDPEEALNQMLTGSGLTYEFINDRTIAVRPLPPQRAPAALPTTQN